MALGDFPLFEESYKKAKINNKYCTFSNYEFEFLELKEENERLKSKLEEINKITLEDYKDTFDVIDRIIKINKIAGGDKWE